MKNQFSLNIKTLCKKNDNQLKKTALQQRKKHSILSSAGFACLALFSFATIQAQNIKTQNNTTEITASTIQDSFIVKGNVSDDFEPIPGVNIVLEGTEFKTVTDFDGNFEFPKKLKRGDVLLFSSVGKESQKVIIENKDSALDIALNINMKLDTVVIMGEVAVKKVYKSKRNK